MIRRVWYILVHVWNMFRTLNGCTKTQTAYTVTRTRKEYEEQRLCMGVWVHSLSRCREVERALASPVKEHFITKLMVKWTIKREPVIYIHIHIYIYMYTIRDAVVLLSRSGQDWEIWSLKKSVALPLAETHAARAGPEEPRCTDIELAIKGMHAIPLKGMHDGQKCLM